MKKTAPTYMNDRKPAEKGLGARENELDLIVSAIPALVWSARPDGSAEFFNQQYLAYVGLPLEKLEGSGWKAAVHPDDLDAMEAAWKSITAACKDGEAEARLRRYDGEYRLFLWRATPVRDRSGAIVKWFGINVDIEDRKRAEQALATSQHNLEAILDTIPGLAWSARADGYTDFSSQRWLEYTGQSAEQAEGWGWMASIHPDDLKRVVDYSQSSMKSGATAEVEARIRRFDGSYRWFLFRTNPLRDESGNILRWYGTNTDIDDRKRVQEALTASERDLRSIINTIPSTAWSARPDGYCEFLNERWLDYTGMTAEQAQGWGWGAAIHPDDLNGLVEYWQSCLASGTPVEAETRLRRYDGEYRRFLIRGNPLHDERGKIGKWYGIGTDIEDRRRAEEALRQSEERARLIVDSIDGLVMTATSKGEVESVNKQVLEYFGKSLEELKDWRINDAIHPDDLSRAAALWTHSVETGEPYQFEQRLRRADNTYRWFRVSGRSLRDALSHVVRWYVLLMDIDDRKRAEVELKRAYDSFADAQRLSHTGNFTADIVADEHIWSAELYRIFEFEPATKITVQMVRDVIHPEDLPSFEARFALSLGGADFDLIYRIVTRSGKMKYVHSIGRVTERVEGRPLFIGAIQDVTESKLAEEALNRARSELAHVARVATLNALTASIAHEVNQPLSGIVTNASTCLRMLDSDPPNVDGARETARRAIRDGNRASDVITRLRALFSKKELTLGPLDLNEATQEVIALSLSDLQRDRVILRSELAADLPPVNGDRIQLQQVILNLLRNASDAMTTVEDRPRELLIRTERNEEDRVCLTVKDVGVGIDPKGGDKLFEPFHTTKKEGMGIGLSVSRSIIEAHQGRLWAEPNDGPGATFSFSIPCETHTKVQ